eukprot:TRINITY_DN5802_c1_g1_i2.p2 TRINITY_DN5802_c1_g1~~TRINITY_DN5802_c1_g1_i2.p2  ORF type:complete len:128 (+),score=21.70 TRINITY_DN5802_c1_g1_i2:28-411(+)
MMTYYHYTNKAGFEGIKQSGYIEQTYQPENNVDDEDDGDDGDDARFGTGVYLTTVAPIEGKKKIVIDCWGPRSNPKLVKNGRVDYVFEIQIPPDQVQKGTPEREVYLYRGRLMLNNFECKPYKVCNT